MISKRKLRERLLDICAGAGANWQEEDNYFEYEDDTLAVTGRIIQGCERAFDLVDKSARLRLPWNLEKFSEIDTMVEAVHDCHVYDLKANS